MKHCKLCGCILGDHYIGGSICPVCLDDMDNGEEAPE